MKKLQAVWQDAAALLLLLLLLPFNLSWVLLALVTAPLRSQSPRPPATADRQTVLISGGKMTKALHLARAFHRAGHRVVLVETHKYWLIGHRFSRAVDRFYTVPKPPSPDYAPALLDIVKRENVDLYVPVCSPIASYYDALASQVLAPHCETLHGQPDMVAKLDDKYQFAQAAQSLGLASPKSFYITDPQQVIEFDFTQETRPYILKSIPYDASRRLDLTKLPCATPAATAAFVHSLPISAQTPWVMQEFIKGQEYCTHSTLKNGQLQVHCCCESSAFQVNYENVEQPAITTWISKFAHGLGLTGQVSFDFMQSDEDGQVYAIECNPRTHSAITLFYDHPDLAQAYLATVDQPLIEPSPSSRPTYWLYHELWRLITHLHQPAEAQKRLAIILQGKEAIFDWDDPLPFLMVHHWQIPLLLLQDLTQLRGWIRIDFNIGKLVQLGGD